jgi:hypothetical protein
MTLYLYIKLCFFSFQKNKMQTIKASSMLFQERHAWKKDYTRCSYASHGVFCDPELEYANPLSLRRLRSRLRLGQ